MTVDNEQDANKAPPTSDAHWNFSHRRKPFGADEAEFVLSIPWIGPRRDYNASRRILERWRLSRYRVAFTLITTLRRVRIIGEASFDWLRA